MFLEMLLYFMNSFLGNEGEGFGTGSCWLLNLMTEKKKDYLRWGYNATAFLASWN